MSSLKPPVILETPENIAAIGSENFIRLLNLIQQGEYLQTDILGDLSGQHLHLAIDTLLKKASALDNRLGSKDKLDIDTPPASSPGDLSLDNAPVSGDDLSLEGTSSSEDEFSLDQSSSSEDEFSLDQSFCSTGENVLDNTPCNQDGLDLDMSVPSEGSDLIGNDFRSFLTSDYWDTEKPENAAKAIERLAKAVSNEGVSPIP